MLSIEPIMKRYLHRYGLKLARFLYWLDGKVPSLASMGSDVYSWLEKKHLCCDRHGYTGGE